MSLELNLSSLVFIEIWKKTEYLNFTVQTKIAIVRVNLKVLAIQTIILISLKRARKEIEKYIKV